MYSFQYPKANTRIGSILVANGLISQEQLDDIIHHQDERPLGQILIEQQFITSAQLRNCLKKQSMLRIVSFIVAFCFTPFHLAHAQDAKAHKKDENSIMVLARAETAKIDMDPPQSNNHITSVEDDLSHNIDQCWDQYDALLSDYAKKGKLSEHNVTLVDFKKLQNDSRFHSIIRDLAEYPLDRLKTTEEKLAFYINVYNVLAMDMVSKHWPILRLKDLGHYFAPVWTHHAGVVGGKDFTLRELEHEVLRKLGEPRIHFAVNCASISCPNLRLEAYRAEMINEQLEDQTEEFLNDRKGIYLKKNTVYLSKIFKWFADDFSEEGGIESFIMKYRPDLSGKLGKTKFQLYDWDITAELTRKELRKAKSS